MTDKNGIETELAADDVVIAIGFRPLSSIRASLQGTGFPVYEVGDGKQVANILRAVWDARKSREAFDNINKSTLFC